MTNSGVHSTMCKELIAYTQQRAVAWAFMDLLLDTWDSVAHYSVLFLLPRVIKFCIQKCTWRIWNAVQFYAWAKLSLFPGRNGVRHLWSVVPMPQMSSNTKECKSQRVKGSQSSKVVRETDWTCGQKNSKGKVNTAEHTGGKEDVFDSPERSKATYEIIAKMWSLVFSLQFKIFMLAFLRLLNAM